MVRFTNNVVVGQFLHPTQQNMSPNRPIVSGKSDLSSPITSTRPLTIGSWPEALNAWVSRRASRMPTNWNACSLVIAYARVWL